MYACALDFFDCNLRELCIFFNFNTSSRLLLVEATKRFYFPVSPSVQTLRLSFAL